MVREREDLGSQIFGIIITAISLLSFVLAFFAVRAYSGTEIKYDTQYITVVLLIIPIWYYGINRTNLTKFYRAKDSIIIMLESGLFVLAGTGILAGFTILFQLNNINLSILLFFAAIDFLLLNLLIIFSYGYHKNLMDKGMNTRNVIVIADQNCVDFVEKLFLHKE